MAACLKLSSCVLVAVLSVVGAQDCSLPPSSHITGYDITACGAWWPNKLSLQDCKVKCHTAGHFGGTPTVSCVANGAGHMFQFGGCTLNDRCHLPAYTAGYDLSKCKSTLQDGSIYTDECEVSCLPYHRNRSMAATCVVPAGTSKLGTWYLTGCQHVTLRGAAKEITGHFLAKLLVLGAIVAGIR
mmetsp:Transcript_8988/g.28584  ORF Transcript_8988/g.28584 Transcript_8988/m.28584 type:complete len:185 (-) Transcript_8988:582-1136(-)